RPRSPGPIDPIFSQTNKSVKHLTTGTLRRNCEGKGATSMSKKVSKVPDSDTSVRTATTELETDAESVSEANGTRQTSNKTGKHSSVQKEAASRPGRGTGSQAKKVA